MKTIIVSDIKNQKNSIITYGLHLARFIESEVDIVHTIDPRSQQGVYSSLSDSQTITPGTKLSHQEIVQREMQYALRGLDKLLSREASRLNYPLRINKLIEERAIISKLKEVVNYDPHSIIIINSEPDNYIFHSFDEITEAISSLKVPVMLVNTDLEFKEPKKIMTIPDYGFSNPDKYAWLNNVLFRDLNHISVINPENMKSKDEYGTKKSVKWLNAFLPGSQKAEIENLDVPRINFYNKLTDAVRNNKPDILSGFKKKKTVLGRSKHRLTAPSKLGRLSDAIPVLFFPS